MNTKTSPHVLVPPITIILFIFMMFLQIQTSTTSSLSSPKQKPFILPLKVQTLPHGTISLPKPSSKLSFQHNVTLTVSLTLGSPPQNVTMVLDTGSELSWLHCKKLPNLNSIFNPLLSSSYTPTPCTSPICITRTQDFPVPVQCDPKKLCHATITYADSTYIEGNLATETFFAGGSAQPGTIFGCMDSGFSSNSNEDSKTTGLMGMNRGSLSFVTQMGLPKFSYCISGKDSTGVLLFGDANIKWVGPLKYTPMVKITTPLPYFDRVAYTVRLEGIRVGKKLLQLPKTIFAPDHTGAGQTMVDSGTQFTFLLGPVYSALRQEFVEQTKGVLTLLEDTNFVFQGAMDLCYRIGSGSVLPTLPAVTLVFEGAEMSVSDLLGIEAYIIGHYHQMNVWMEFDLVNSRVGFADTKCELASQRPAMHFTEPRHRRNIRGC